MGCGGRTRRIDTEMYDRWLRSRAMCNGDSIQLVPQHVHLRGNDTVHTLSLCINVTEVNGLSEAPLVEIKVLFDRAFNSCGHLLGEPICCNPHGQIHLDINREIAGDEEVTVRVSPQVEIDTQITELRRGELHTVRAGEAAGCGDRRGGVGLRLAADPGRHELLELSSLARRAYRAALSAAHLEDLRGLLATWRYLHRWAALMVVLLVAVHIASALRYADLSWLGGGG